MRKIGICAVTLLVLLLCACSGAAEELPEPEELFQQISQSVELPEMIDVASELLESNTGIAPADYESAVYYILAVDTAPDEIVIVRAVDSAAADTIQEKLEGWLDHRIDDARFYLTEYMPMLQAGVVRRDGLTVSLIVSDQVNEIAAFYDGLT